MKRFSRVFAASSLIISILANAQVKATTTNATLAQTTQETPTTARTIEEQGWKFDLQNEDLNLALIEQMNYQYSF